MFRRGRDRGGADPRRAVGDQGVPARHHRAATPADAIPARLANPHRRLDRRRRAADRSARHGLAGRAALDRRDVPLRVRLQRDRQRRRHARPAFRVDGPERGRRARGGGVLTYCSGGSPVVRFFARSISVTAIRISARVLRSGASSIACFSGGPYGDIITSALTSASLGALSTPSQSTLRLLALRKSVSTLSKASRSTASSPLRAVKSSMKGKKSTLHCRYGVSTVISSITLKRAMPVSS